ADLDRQPSDAGTEPRRFHRTDREPFIVPLLETVGTANKKRWRGIRCAKLLNLQITASSLRRDHPTASRHNSIVWMNPPGKRRISQRSQTRAACDTPTVPPESISGTQRIEGS